AQGRLLGKMQALGFALRDQATLAALTSDVLNTSKIEGLPLNPDAVRSSLARRLGVEIGALTHADRHVEGIVEMVLDATHRFDARLTQQRLFGWHAALFPTGYSGLSKIRTAAWRDDAEGAMQVVSGSIGRPKVHYQAPPAHRLRAEMRAFLTWFNGEQMLDPVIKAGLAHLWFVTIHPFDDGNGRIARAIGDMGLARSEATAQRFYSLSAQIQRERRDYYDLLEKTQRGEMDVTAWLAWFLACLGRAIKEADSLLEQVLMKAQFWERCAGVPLNARQIKLINKMLDGFDGKLTSAKWASIAKCSADSALRDINDLIERGLLKKSDSGGRSRSYDLLLK
ncbi:MAG: Fic family protein, partial [Gallionella sp.]